MWIDRHGNQHEQLGDKQRKHIYERTMKTFRNLSDGDANKAMFYIGLLAGRLR